MTQELCYLALTAALTGLLWVPVVVGYVHTRGFLRPSDYKKPPDSPLPDWVNRANRAHQNAVESFAPFAALVLIGHVTETTNSAMQILVAVYFWSRLVHAIIHIAGWGFLNIRTLVFSVSSTAMILYFVQLLFSA